jgi:uncharacterized membrane protein YccC
MPSPPYPTANETPSAIRIIKPDMPGGAKRTLWRTLTKFDRSKVSVYRGFRNAAGVALPLIIGFALNMPRGGLAVASGALNVSYSDGSDPYPRRAKRMIGSAILCSLGIFAGAISGPHTLVTIAVTTAWAFIAGMMVALGPNAGDLGVISLAFLMVYAAQPLSPHEAGIAGALALGGGLLQAALSVALWPVQRYDPERNALAKLFIELADTASSQLWSTAAPAASAEFEGAQTAMSGLDSDNSLEAVRFRSILSQAQRVRLSILMLARLRLRLARERDTHIAVQLADQGLQHSAVALRAVASSLTTQHFSNSRFDLDILHQIARRLASSPLDGCTPFFAAAMKSAAFQIDALAGQLRAVMDLASHSTLEGQEQFDKAEARHPWSLRFRGIYATIRANLTLQSSAFRHAIRLAVMAAIGEALGREMSWRRSVWLPMTVIIVLKPEFTTTFTRGLLRVGGTIVGLLLATGLFHFLPINVVSEIILIFAFVFVLRWVGPANYGLFAIAISAVVVLMIAMNGTSGASPKDVILARGINTFAGGALALLAYWLWPTRELAQLKERLAEVLQAYSTYFSRLAGTYIARLDGSAEEIAKETEAARQKSRVARSNFEGSLDRLSSEPGTTKQQLDRLNAMRASSHRLVHAIMAIDAGWLQTSSVPARPPFKTFVADVEKTMALLVDVLHGARVQESEFPNLRQDHNALIETGDPDIERYALVNVEADRITNSLDTLHEQILEWLRDEHSHARHPSEAPQPV